MISLLILPLLLLPNIMEQTCNMAEMEERFVRMDERMEERMEERVKEIKAEMKEEMEEKEAVLRKELASKEDIGRAMTQGLRDLPYLTLCAYQDEWTSGSSTITYDKFLTDFNNGDRPGGADGQLNLGTGAFNCLHDGIYSITFSGNARLDPAEQVSVYLYLNEVQLPDSWWHAYSSSTIGGYQYVPGSRSLVSVHPLLIHTENNVMQIALRIFPSSPLVINPQARNFHPLQRIQSVTGCSQGNTTQTNIITFH